MKITPFFLKIVTMVIAITSFESIFAAKTQQELKEPVYEDTEAFKKLDLPQVSQSLGYLLGKNIHSLGVDLDVQKVIQGISDCLAGKEAPMPEQDTIQAISVIQENVFQKESKANLYKAEKFLATNAANKQVKELIPGKLQYIVRQSGKGKMVQESSHPKIRYIGKFLDGSVFGSSEQDQQVSSLEEMIPGVTKSLIGMREGERRTVYMHPELGYGASGALLPPNALLTFELEVVQADAPLEKKQDDREEIPELATSMDPAAKMTNTTVR